MRFLALLIISLLLPVRAFAGQLAEAITLEERYHDCPAALKILRPLAEQGNATAQRYLGGMYLYGHGVEKNEEQAAKWFGSAFKSYEKRAAEGDTGGQFWIGRMYELGEGTKQDCAEGLKWQRLAAEKGDAYAQWEVGTLYSRPWGQPTCPYKVDINEANKWYRKSAEQGFAAAEYDMGLFYEGGAQMNETEALKWLQKAADQGYSPAERHLSSWYFGKKDYAHALMWEIIERRVSRSRALKRVPQEQVAASDKKHFDILKDLYNFTPDHLKEAERLAADWKLTPSPLPTPAEEIPYY